MQKINRSIFTVEFLRSSAFLFSLIVVIFIMPFLDDNRLGRLFVSLMVLTTVAGAFTVMFSHRHMIRFMGVIFGLSVIVDGLSWLFEDDFFTGVTYLRNSIIYAIFAGILFYYLMKVKPLSLSEIGNAISIYLLAGLSFGFFYCYYSIHHPDAFSQTAGSEKNTLFNLIYFSFITLTTTGFGDILPLMKVTRLLSIFEAVFGTFYIAVIIGRLVGVGGRSNLDG